MTQPTKKRGSKQTGKLERLHKIIARSGAASLRESERLIAEGEVTVNGELVTKKGASADPAKDTIRVKGKVVLKETTLAYLVANKPTGLVTTRSDEKGRKTVMELLPKAYQTLYPVGRLDINSEGLLIFTNDGAFAQALMAPKNRVERVYKVKVRNIPEEKTLKKAMRGITIDGEKLKVESVKISERTSASCWLTVTLMEGKNRHIRRLFEPLGHPVVKLKRVSFGPLKIGDLKPGEVKHLTSTQITSLKKVAGAKRGK